MNLVFRKKKTILVISFVLLVFIYFSSRTVKINHHDLGMSIMTFNLLYSSSNNLASINAIKNAKPDILCLRELTAGFVKLFKKQLTTEYPYTVFETRTGTWGAGIASRFPISNTEYFPVRPHHLPGLEANLSTTQGDIFVSCLHLFPPFGKHLESDNYWVTYNKNKQLRQNQAKYLIQRYKTINLPMLIIGDMNETANDLALKVFKRNGFKHACENTIKEDCGATYPGPKYIWPALIEIDHILGKNIQFHSAAVLNQGGSDHYPVIASFSIKSTN